MSHHLLEVLELILGVNLKAQPRSSLTTLVQRERVGREGIGGLCPWIGGEGPKAIAEDKVGSTGLTRLSSTAKMTKCHSAPASSRLPAQERRCT